MKAVMKSRAAYIATLVGSDEWKPAIIKELMRLQVYYAISWDVQFPPLVPDDEREGVDENDDDGNAEDIDFFDVIGSHFEIESRDAISSCNLKFEGNARIT
jgi:hypothetical protein